MTPPPDVAPPGAARHPYANRLAALFLALLAAASRDAQAADVNGGRPPASAQACAAAPWRLEGAASLPGKGEEALFDPAWEALLDQAAACLRSEEGRHACLEVEGRFDETSFSPHIITAFGSISGAQNARARARANGVLSRLAERGVAAQQLREVHPRMAPSWRGVELRLVAECLPRPASLSAEDRAAVTEVRQLVSGGELKRAIAARDPAPAPVPGPPLLAGLWVEAGASGSLGVAAPAAAVGPGLRLGAGLARSRWYGRLGLSGSLMAREAQRTSVEVAVGGGRSLLPWLTAGLQAGVRTGAPAPHLPWLEQGWFLALESRQCLLRLGESTSLCVEEALGAGLQVRRGVVTGDRLERIPPTNDFLFRAELSVLVQHDLF